MVCGCQYLLDQTMQLKDHVFSRRFRDSKSTKSDKLQRKVVSYSQILNNFGFIRDHLFPDRSFQTRVNTF